MTQGGKNRSTSLSGLSSDIMSATSGSLENSQVLIQPVLSYLVYALQSGTVDNVKLAAIGYFTDDQIGEAKDALWNHCGSEIIGNKPKRKESQSRSVREAHIMDILTAWAKLESCDKLPTVVINAIDLCKIPNSHPEELNNITLIDCLNRMETHMSQMQAGLDEVVARNLMFNDKLNEMSSYASKVKASTLSSQASHLKPAETARQVEQTRISNTLVSQRTQELVVDNAENIKQNVDNDSFQQPAYVLKQ